MFRITHGTVGVGDEIVTLKNERRLRPSPDDFVRNGDRWRVRQYGLDGSLSVEPFAPHAGGSSAHSRADIVTLPADYAKEHVALGYALTVHKAQGTTTDRAIVIVDEKMTAPQLYVAMSRGREENSALVVSSDSAVDEHSQRPVIGGLRLLAEVMRREGADRSAHDVPRSNLARCGDSALLHDLTEETRQLIDRKSNPDHTKEIATLTSHADLIRTREQIGPQL